MNSIAIRFTDGLYYATPDTDPEIEGIGDTISEALKDLAEQLETEQI